MKIQSIISSIGLVGSIAGGAYFIEDRYIDTKEHAFLESGVMEINQKLESKILSDELYLVRERMWKIRDRLDREPTNRDLEKALSDLELRSKDLQKQLDLMRISK